MRVRYILLLLAAILALYLALWPTGRSFQPYLVPTVSGLRIQADTLLLDTVDRHGTLNDYPRGVARSHDGAYYTTLPDGHVDVLDSGAVTWRSITLTYGTPQNLAFDVPQRWLYLADSHQGLLRSDRQGHLERLSDSSDLELLGQLSDLTIAPDGTIYLLSAVSGREAVDYYGELLTGRPTGRLLHYRPDTRQLTVLLDSLFLPRSLACSPDGSRLAIAEYGRSCITTFQRDPAGRLSERNCLPVPGHPTAVAYGPQQSLWVAVPHARLALIDRLAARPALREVLYRLPERYRRRLSRSNQLFLVETTGSLRPVHIRGERDLAVRDLHWQKDELTLTRFDDRQLQTLRLDTTLLRTNSHLQD